MASIQHIHVSDKGVRASRTVSLTDYQGRYHHASRSTEAILTEQGRDLKHEIKLLKRRLAYARNVETPRSYPGLDWIKHQLLIHAQGPLLTINEDGEFSAKDLTRAYVQQFCKANHLKEA